MERAPAVFDPCYQLGNEALLGFDERKPVFVLYEKQGREILNPRMGGLVFKFASLAINDGQMVMAGLWAKWKSTTSGEEVLSCTILTCGPNQAMGELHDRMPVILGENDWPKWLGEELASEQDLLALLKPCRDEALKIWPVDKMVGNVRNNGPQLILPVLSNEVPA